MTQLVLPPVELPVERPLAGVAGGRRARVTAGPARVLRVSSALGPAFVTAVAYVDPGNFATNFDSGARTGYALVWVVVLAGLVAMPIQYLSAKLGIATGRNLPQLCRDLLPGRLHGLMWLQAEVVAMATDLAEFVGAAIGLHLLFRMPLPACALTTAVLALVVLRLQRRGHRPFEVAIALLLLFIFAGFGYLMIRLPSATPDGGGALTSGGPGSSALLLAIGIVGATVMPHAIYLHSDLTSRRVSTDGPAQRSRLLRLERLDIAIAMGLAGLVNLSMLILAARLFHHSATPVDTLQEVHTGLGHLVGGGAALAFAAALLASGISSSSVGTAAGQVVMSGFLGASIPLWLRRLVTMAPAVVLLCSGIDPTRALVLSQVVLSFGIPFALVPLLVLTSRPALMGEHVNHRVTVVAMSAVTALITALNLLFLLRQADL